MNSPGAVKHVSLENNWALAFKADILQQPVKQE